MFFWEAIFLFIYLFLYFYFGLPVAWLKPGICRVLVRSVSLVGIWGFGVPLRKPHQEIGAKDGADVLQNAFVGHDGRDKGQKEVGLETRICLERSPLHLLEGFAFLMSAGWDDGAQAFLACFVTHPLSVCEAQIRPHPQPRARRKRPFSTPRGAPSL